jgi:hypothetical protein
VFVPGLYRFEVNNDGDLLLYYQSGADPPDFMINDDGDLIANIA